MTTPEEPASILDIAPPVLDRCAAVAQELARLLLDLLPTCPVERGM